jgi:hypothetical protein
VVIIVSDSVQLWVYLEQLELVYFCPALGTGTVRVGFNSVQLWDS